MGETHESTLNGRDLLLIALMLVVLALDGLFPAATVRTHDPASLPQLSPNGAPMHVVGKWE
jgi:hypothetical protein